MDESDPLASSMGVMSFGVKKTPHNLLLKGGQVRSFALEA